MFIFLFFYLGPCQKSLAVCRARGGGGSEGADQGLGGEERGATGGELVVEATATTATKARPTTAATEHQHA